jgi:hypothetical protein
MMARAPMERRPDGSFSLPSSLRASAEIASGRKLDAVRVFPNSPKPAVVQAHAFTQGTDIHLAPGQEHHLAHETWHAVQQMKGQVRPTAMLAGMPINHEARLERDADAMGEQLTRRSHDVRTLG